MANSISASAADGPDIVITHTADIVVSYLTNNSLDPGEVSSLIRSVYKSLGGLGKQAEETRPDPAVPIRSSVKNSHIICLEDGRKMKMLKRHLMTDHGLTPGEYRTRWGLSQDYPMVAPDYAEKRRDLAKKIGLGRMPSQKRSRRNKKADKA